MFKQGEQTSAQHSERIKMPKIKLKNSNTNQLITYIKDNDITMTSDVTINQNGKSQKVSLNASTLEVRNALIDLLQNYNERLYHNTTFSNDLNIKNMFNYLSNDYENNTISEEERSLPNFYLENVNVQNDYLTDLKALNFNYITKNAIDSLGSKQQGLNVRGTQQLNKFKNILFGNGFIPSRSKDSVNNFPYYNKIEIGSMEDKNYLSRFLYTILFQEEMFANITANNNTTGVSFTINDSEESTTIPVMDLNEIVQSTSAQLDLSDKIILGTQKQNSSYVTNNFKKFVLADFIRSKYKEDLKTFDQMVNSVECRRENILYKIDKYIDTDSSPVQTFWMHGYSSEQAREYVDYQIKKDNSYRYKLSTYCLIFGNRSTVSNIDTSSPSMIKFDMQISPSYKIAIVDFEEVSVTVNPKMLPAPFVQFVNQNNSENKIKIYLDMKNESKKEKFIPIIAEDANILENSTDENGMVDFEYQKQDGKFEVFRLTEKPDSYEDFENAKVLEVRNKISSTSVVFMENVKPNKKYYYMFRSVNFVGMPSNPSPVYEVELMKMASSSKVVVSVVDMTKDEEYKDKSFKNLLQIKPAFQQEIFDDQSDYVEDLDSFRKKINDLTLGTATDKIWGKKMKIRIKSKDSGKIIDLNVKFNLIKDNIK
jgi:hypothetical protein